MSNQSWRRKKKPSGTKALAGAVSILGGGTLLMETFLPLPASEYAAAREALESELESRADSLAVELVREELANPKIISRVLKQEGIEDIWDQKAYRLSLRKGKRETASRAAEMLGLESHYIPLGIMMKETRFGLDMEKAQKRKDWGESGMRYDGAFLTAYYLANPDSAPDPRWARKQAEKYPMLAEASRALYRGKKKMDAWKFAKKDMLARNLTADIEYAYWLNRYLDEGHGPEKAREMSLARFRNGVNGFRDRKALDYARDVAGFAEKFERGDKALAKYATARYNQARNKFMSLKRKYFPRSGI
jgi:hypothetical protein